MVTVGAKRIIRYLRNAALGQDKRGPTDGALLELFLSQRDEAAFSALLKRYGPMVLGVCRRILHNRHDAEDAFQAVFLVLVRKGSSIVPREMVGNWLYGVACRTAQEARRAAAKRQLKERTRPRHEAQEETPMDDVPAVLDRELQALPDIYRAPIVCCDLRGETRKEAARQLGCPEGTVAGRLARGRNLLARRLVKRGIVVPAAGLALYFSQNATCAAVPAALAAATVKAAVLYSAGEAAVAGAVSAEVAALTEGVLQAMFLTKMKTLASIVAALAFLTAGLGLVGHGVWAANAHALTSAVAQDTQKPPASDKEKPAGNRDKENVAQDKKDEAKKGNPNETPFSKIHVKMGKVSVRQTGKQSLEAKGDPRFVQMVKTGVDNDTLHLEALPGVEFSVEVKDLSALTVEGIGSVDVKDLKTKRLEVTVKSAGKVHISGTAEEQVIDVSGPGKFDGEACKGKQAEVRVNGGGQVAVDVSDKLRVNIQGGGRVYYLGSPTVEKNVDFGGHLAQGPAPANVGGFGRQGPQPFQAFPGRWGGLQFTEKRLGAQLEPPSPTLIAQLGLPDKQGMVLKDVQKDSAADKADLKANDIILELDGKPVPSSPNAFIEFLNGIKAEQKLAVVVIRKGQKTPVKELALPEAKNPPGFQVPPFPKFQPMIPPVPPLPPLPPLPPGGFPPNPPAGQ